MKIGILSFYFAYNYGAMLQPNLQHPSVIHPKRMDFERDYIKHGFKYVMYNYGDAGWRYKYRKFKQRVKNKIKWIVNKIR